MKNQQQIDAQTQVGPLTDQQKELLELSPMGGRLEACDNTASVLLGRELAEVWQTFESQLSNVSFVKRVEQEQLSLEEYRCYLRDMRAQVVEGARWLTRAASNMRGDYLQLRKALVNHAQVEQTDYILLEKNYVACGGRFEDVENPAKNIGSEGLSAYIFDIANKENPLELFGATFIFEGLGCVKAGPWAKHIKKSLSLNDNAVSFLAYHGENDDDHYDNLAKALSSPLVTEQSSQRIVKSARVVAFLYASQLANLGIY